MQSLRNRLRNVLACVEEERESWRQGNSRAVARGGESFSRCRTHQDSWTKFVTRQIQETLITVCYCP
jgi:hypothetical protein